MIIRKRIKRETFTFYCVQYHRFGAYITAEVYGMLTLLGLKGATRKKSYIHLHISIFYTKIRT